MSRHPKFRHVFCALSMLVALSAAGSAQTDARAREVDAFMKQQMTARHIPGAAVAVVSHGRTVLIKGYGLADVEHGVRVVDHTVFELGSVTKQFTATAIMILVQDRKLSLEDSVGGLLDNLPDTWRGLTIRQLLTHTSGLPEYSRPEFHLDFRRDYSRQDLLGLVTNAPLDFAPGAQLSYSNTGYFLLGVVIEKASGKSYGDFLRERIFERLGMKDTRLNDRTSIIGNRAHGYSLVDYVVTNAPYVSPTTTFAAGGLVSSAADMALWLQAQGSTTLLTHAHWDAMWTKTRLNGGASADYGFGWYVRANGPRKRLEHSGGVQGFSAYTANFVDDSLSVMFLANSDVPVGRLGAGLSEIYLPSLRYSPPKPIADADTAMTTFLRRLASALMRGKGDSSWYTAKVQSYYFPSRIAARKAIGALGPMHSFDLIDVTEDAGRQRRTYLSVLGENRTRFIFWVTRDGKVDGVDFEIE